VFDNDPTIAGNERLLRRIHPQQLVPDERNAGKRRVSSGAFRDEELSIVIESTLLKSGRQPIDLLQAYERYSLVAITAAKARSHDQSVARDPIPDEPAHGVVFGRKKKCAGSLADSASWVVPSDAPSL
jgi:hypothetical protein